MTDTFSSNSEAVLQRGSDVTLGTKTPLENIEEQYQIKKTCDFINHNGFQKVGSGTLFNSRDIKSKTMPTEQLNICKHETEGGCILPLFKLTISFVSWPQVALQFPDVVLVDSVSITTEIERNTSAKLFILGDTSYGR